ncbi:MAG: hypothetical protein R3C05_27360 [Pirellulaceae bacterium]
MQSYEADMSNGKKVWSARFAIPVAYSETGTREVEVIEADGKTAWKTVHCKQHYEQKVSQQTIDRMLKDGVHFRLDHYLGQPAEPYRQPIVVDESVSTWREEVGAPFEDGDLSRTEDGVTTQVFRATVVNIEHSQPLFGVWTVEKIISAGEVVPADKTPGEIEFRGNQMIWKRTGKIRGADRVFDFDLDMSKSPHWFTFRSQDPKRPQPVLALLETSGRYQQPPEPGNPPTDEQLPQIRIFSRLDANGNPPGASIASGNWRRTRNRFDRAKTQVAVHRLHGSLSHWRRNFRLAV